MKNNQKEQKERLPRHFVIQMERLGSAYSEKMKEASDIEKELNSIVKEYMEGHKLWKNREAIQEVIDHLPAGHLRFTMLDRYYDLETKSDQRRAKRQEYR